MTALESLKTWLATYPDSGVLSKFQIDYTDKIPGSGGVFPSGLVEVSRKPDILGNVTVVNQYNFGLYYTFAKSPDDNTSATVNADWLMDFQEWVQAQSATCVAPKFGDEPTAEKIIAQNGALYDTTDEGTALYMVQLSVQFKKFFKR